MNKTIKTLNEKWWYRLIKILYVFWFVLTLVVFIIITSSIIDDKVITDSSYEKIGQTIKQEYSPAYDDISDIEIGKRVYEKRYDEWLKHSNLIEYKAKYSLTEKVTYYLISILTAIIILELVKRLFYYVYFGSLLPQKK